MSHGYHMGPKLMQWGLLVAALLLLGAAWSRGGSSASPTTAPAAAAAASATASASAHTSVAATATSRPTATVTPSPTPTATPSPTPFVPPTVAVVSNDDVRSCLTRNLTPELLISLSKNDDSLANDIIRTCLETQMPSQLVFLLGPIVDSTSQCALDTSKTLSNQDLIALAGPDGATKDAVVNRVTDAILACVADKYHIPTSIFGL